MLISGEWCLVTELPYGKDVVLKKLKMVHRLLNIYFDSLFDNINLKQFNLRFEDFDFEAMDDINALKIALYYFVDMVLNGRKTHCQINFSLLKQVDGVDHF